MLNTLADGLYKLDYKYGCGDAGAAGSGLAVLRRDIIFGSDPGGGVFQGTVSWDAATDRYCVRGSLIVAAHAELITDLAAGDDGMECAFQATGGGVCFTAEIAGRQIGVKVRYVGPLPNERGP